MKYTEELNKKLIQSIEKTYPIGLAQGQMGICLYFYYLSRIEQEKKYKKIAENLLDNTLGKLSLDSSIGVESGLAGVALGIMQLIRDDFVEGDVNELLEEIDNVVFKRLAFLSDSSFYKKNELLHLLYYLSIRSDDQVNDEELYIFQELIIKVINLFYEGLNSDFFNEYYSFSVYHYHLPMFSYICSKLLKQNFYNEKLLKILEEFEYSIICRLPVLHANRLYLLCGMLPLIPYMKNPQWEKYIIFLRKEISLSNILKKEMKNKQIFVSNGLSMIYLLLYYLESNYPEYKITYNPQEFYDKIINSEAWTSLFKHDYFFNIHSGLLNGFLGVELVLSHIQKHNT
nr:lanthionine synthetase LanC family protein [uncultured Macellibacteroides sp.]